MTGRQVSIYLDAALDTLLDHVAEQSGTSKSAIIESALYEWIKGQVKKYES